MTGAERHASLQQGMHVMQHHTGVVMPVYLPAGIDIAQGEALLHDTVAGYVAQVADPTAVCLSVDGNVHGETVAAQLSETFGVLMTAAAVNRGKLQGARLGTQELLRVHPDLRYIAVVDQDGDHFANELLNFIRAALHIAAQSQDPRVMILGRRISLHRPMGLLRGELEKLADQITLDALHYHAAIHNHPLRLEYATLLDGVPDFHSGYKLFSREIAEAIFLSEPHSAGFPEDVYYRHACEAVMSVEALLADARLGVINRSTFNAQPVSTFGLYDRAQLTADLILWPCRRLDVPVSFVRQWLANYIPPLLLSTLSEGREELRAVCRLMLQGLGEAPDTFDPYAYQPLFL